MDLDTRIKDVKSRISPPMQAPIGEDRPPVRVGVVVGGVALVLMSICVAGPSSATAALFFLFGEDRLPEVAGFAGIVAATAAVHTAVTWWAYATRPGWLRFGVTQAPFLLVYVIGGPWWYHSRFPIGYLPWALAALLAAAGLLLWFLRKPSRPRRVVALLASFAVLVAVNAAGVASIVWKSTNGLGLVGAASPWEAWWQAEAASCTSDDWYGRADGARQADCPRGPNSDRRAGIYAATEFDAAACPTAIEPFRKFLTTEKTYNVGITLEYVPDGSPVEHGDTATLAVNVQLVNVTQYPFKAPSQVTADRRSERWTVRIDKTTLGGWKVCQIDVASPITFTPTQAGG